jgi:adenylate cyclase class IV
MFEVEKKFKLTEDEKIRLLDGAEFVGEKTFIDVYYDSSEFALTKNDMWLRKRGEIFELKIPMYGALGNSLMQQYQEIEGEQKIREIFAIAPLSDFESDIRSLGYEIFCICKTNRKKYLKNGFTIDLDFVVFENDDNEIDFTYVLAEVELLVENKDQMSEAVERIEKFAKEQGLKNDYVRGKVIEYLFRKKPKHFEVLVTTGVVRE